MGNTEIIRNGMCKSWAGTEVSTANSIQTMIKELNCFARFGFFQTNKI
jgi:hypothetical protein